jgi:putative oxidoreductase
MPPFLSRYEEHLYAVMRIIIGFLFLQHGLSKLVGWPVPLPQDVPGFVIWIAGPIELVGGFLVMIGLFAGWGAFLASGLMAFAYFLAHQKNALLPIANQGEPAVVYCFVFLYIAARGSGIWSVDAARDTGGTRVTVEVRTTGVRVSNR